MPVVIVLRIDLFLVSSVAFFINCNLHYSNSDKESTSLVILNFSSIMYFVLLSLLLFREMIY